MSEETNRLSRHRAGSIVADTRSKTRLICYGSSRWLGRTAGSWIHHESRRPTGCVSGSVAENVAGAIVPVSDLIESG